jgi:hypothetical protein
MAGTRMMIRDRKEYGKYARNRICCVAAAAALLILAIFFRLDRNTMTVGPIGSAEPIDFSSLAATVIPLDEFWANDDLPPVTATSALALSATSGIKSDFMQTANLKRHLENAVRDTGREPAVLAAT